MSKLIVIFLLARLGRKGKCSTGGGGGVRILNATAIFVQPCSHMLFLTYLTKHMMSFFVFTMFCIEKRSLFPPQLKILTLTFIIIIQH